MTAKQVLGQLLNSENAYSQNIFLLKKIMLTTYLGRLRINDHPPDRNFSLMDYLFDDERIMFDFTRLSDAQRQKFTKWLLEKHQDQKTPLVLSNVGTNEYRGFTAEVSLSWWGQLMNWLFNSKVQDQWQLADFSLSMDYQLLGLEMCEGNKGILVGFQHLLAPELPNKYHDPKDLQQEPIGNTKRVYITDAVVDKLTNTSVHKLDFEKIVDRPHPQSVCVKDLHHRFKAMSEYRQIQQFNYKPWYIVLLDWFISLFVAEPKPAAKFNTHQIEPLLQADGEGVSIYRRSDTGEIIVVEPRPDIDVMVFCGGGAKMFAHVGVMEALQEQHIQASRFSGSSAGAFIALMNYLGYEAHEVLDFLKQFKQENLIHYDIDRHGLSSSTGLKAAVDFMIAKKVEEICLKYKIRHPEGLITFATLDNLRERCPGCGIGKELVVTATNMRESKTRYFSLLRTPNKEVSEVVTASASLPVVYRPMLIEGEEHSDGGILNNFPTEAFCDDQSTLLEAENGNNLKLLAVQFDNGTERSTIDKTLERVYKENMLLNWCYRLVTGINDPASGWEQDRIKLRQHALQSVIVNVGDVGAAEFNLSEHSKADLVNNGYSAAKEYIKTRFKTNANGVENDEFMYSTFSSLGDLLSYCCYRNQKLWFDKVHELIKQSHDVDKKALLQQAEILKSLYFDDDLREERFKPGFFGRSLSTSLSKIALHKENYDHFRALYPLCLLMSQDYIELKQSKAAFEKIRHSFNLQSPLYRLGHDFATITGKQHILFHISVVLLKQLNAQNCQEFYEIIADLTQIFKNNRDMSAQFFGEWNLDMDDCMHFLKLFKNNNIKTAKEECISIQAKTKPPERAQIKPVKEIPTIPVHLLGRVML